MGRRAAGRALTEQALELYSGATPNVTFRFTWQGNAGYYDRLSTQAAGGNAPDLFQIDDDYLTEYAQRQILLDLTEYVRAGELDLRGFPTGLALYGQVGGRTVAVAAAQNTPGLVYNQSLLDRLGLPEPRIGMSYPEYLAWAERVTEAQRRPGGRHHGPVRRLQGAVGLAARAAARSCTRAGRSGSRENDLTRWFELWRDARRSGATPTRPGSFSAPTVATSRGNWSSPGDAAASFAWSNQLPELQKLTRDKLGVVGYPGTPEAQWARASIYWAGFRGTRHPDLVARRHQLPRQRRRGRGRSSAPTVASAPTSTSAGRCGLP